MRERLNAVETSSNDKELFDAVSAVVSIPKKRQSQFFENSFILHAPLELCARYYLLPLVDEPHSQAARERIKMIARRYSKYEDDVVSTDAVQGIKDIVKWSRSHSHAGHATILLALLDVLDDTNESLIEIMNRMNSFISEGDNGTINEIASSNSGFENESLLQWLINNVANATSVEGDTTTIKAIVQSAENAGVIEPLVSCWRNSDYTRDDYIDFLYPALMRISTLSMLKEDETNSKYGWSHALTIPHSHFVLAKSFGEETELFISALTYVAAFRSTMGRYEITSSDFQNYFDQNEESIFTSHYEEITKIISLASTMEDAHLVKYVYTNFDLMKRDPQYSALYIAAAKRLLDIWLAA